MSFKVEQMEEKNMVKLVIESTAEEFEAGLNKAYNKDKNKISIPGFRKGKAPRKMIEQMYGAEVFYEDAANAIIPEAYATAAEESKLEIVSQPKISVVQLEKGTLKITVGTPGNGGNGSGRNAGPGTNGTATTVSVNGITLLTLGGGNGGGGTGNSSGANNGAGGTITVSSKLKIISTKIKTNGTAQSTVSILGNGFGAGGNIRGGTSGLPGTAGYIKIQFVK